MLSVIAPTATASGCGPTLRDNLGRSMSGVLLNEYGDDGAPTPLPIHES